MANPLCPTCGVAASEHPAGRCMDAWVAEAIFGLVPCQAECHHKSDGIYIPGPCHAFPESPDQGGETACYSTDIAAAWQVLNQVLLNGGKDWVAFLRYGTCYLWKAPASCEIVCQPDALVYAPKAHTTASDMPLAICVAALCAKAEKEAT
jgi:hypothetical protein